MTHLSENSHRLSIKTLSLTTQESVQEQIVEFDQVCLLILPSNTVDRQSNSPKLTAELIDNVASKLSPESTLIVMGEVIDLVHAHTRLAKLMQYHLWIVIKRTTPRISKSNSALPEYHFGALVYTGYIGSLRHSKTRIKYTYCPACEKTTKDYGGKKHTYNSYGTLMSDVWRDISAEINGDLSHITERFADLFGIEGYSQLLVLDCRGLKQGRIAENRDHYIFQPMLLDSTRKPSEESRLILGDSLEELGKLPSNSVDFAFADPPYNLKKKYNNYSDDLSITDYFAWCDDWINEVARILRPGRTCAILNIPLWAIRHFLHMDQILQFQNWIVWDALSFPVRFIMPAHYGILCFSKGPARELPGLAAHKGDFNIEDSSKAFQTLQPLAEWYCLRASCIRKRQLLELDDRGPLTDLWWDIHRLKHNSRRVDHPCQLPPQLMYRLYSIFTEPGEIILDCFNGAGTSTLTAHQLDRKYIGIEISEKYHKIAQSRHYEIEQGLDPFRKANRKLTEKNSSVNRMKKQTYEVPNKALQLEIRRVAKLLGRLPDRNEVIEHGRYPIKYYDDYFVSWGEVCAAARHDGMSEEKEIRVSSKKTTSQLSLFD